MPKDITGVHDSVYLQTKRRPEFQVLLYDSTENLSEIVLGNSTQTPVDITKYISRASITEKEGSATTASLTIIQDSDVDILSPYHFIGRRIIRILYIDSAVLERGEDWLVMFTGATVGQPGYRRSRDGHSEISVKCMDRSIFYKDDKLESPKYPKGDDLGEIAVDLATNGTYGFGLEREEVKWGLFREEVQHNEVSFFDVFMMEGLELIGFIVGKRPAWDGEGNLEMRDVSLDKSPMRTYDDQSLFVDLTWPQVETNIHNKIRVTGLDSEMTQITSPSQNLAKITGTVGYFQDEYRTKVYYSEDRSARALNVIIGKYKINGQLSSFIKGKAKLKKITVAHCTVVIETPYNAWLFIIFFIVYIVFWAVGTIPIFGNVVFVPAAIWLCLGLALMQALGTFEVEVNGAPYKMVYKEVEGTAQWANLLSYETNELPIENHLVYSKALADSLAFRELKKEAVKGAPRSLNMPIDPVLEWSDIIELPDDSRYYVDGITRNFERDNPINMQVTFYMVRSGNEQNRIPGFPEF